MLMLPELPQPVISFALIQNMCMDWKDLHENCDVLVPREAAQCLIVIEVSFENLMTQLHTSPDP